MNEIILRHTLESRFIQLRSLELLYETHVSAVSFSVVGLGDTVGDKGITAVKRVGRKGRHDRKEY